MSHGDYDLTNEDDIKLYLENIETEYSYQCLSEKDPGGKWFIGLYNLPNQTCNFLKTDELGEKGEIDAFCWKILRILVIQARKWQR